MKDCIFCKVIKGKLPSQKIKETDNILVIKDINPQADMHFLIIPKQHVRDIMGLSESEWSEIKKVSLDLMKENDIKDFRIVTNAGNAALVHHMHVHLLAKVAADRKL